MSELRIGLLGASRIAPVAIVLPAAQLGHRVVAVASRDRHRSDAFARANGVERVLDSYADLIDDQEIDVVYNGLANSLHARWNLAAVKAGKAVLTEKPFASNAFEAEVVTRAARERGVVIMEGFHYLFHPIIGRMFSLLADGILGKLTHVEVVMTSPEPCPGDPRWSLELAGGCLMDLGCYGLHVSRQLGRFAGGNPTITGARAVERFPGIDESIDIDLQFPSGATGLLVNSMAAGQDEMSIRIVGDKGVARAHDFLLQRGDDRITIATGTATTVEHLGSRSTYCYQLDAFASHLFEDSALPMDPNDAVLNMQYLDAAYAAAGLSPRRPGLPDV